MKENKKYILKIMTKHFFLFGLSFVCIICFEFFRIPELFGLGFGIGFINNILWMIEVLEK
jgi:hypothetical protein